MTNQNKRKHLRLKHRAKIRVINPPADSFIVDMLDFSEGGLFLLWEGESFVNIDDIIDVQTMEFEDAPIQRVKVIRIEPGKGFAAAFTNP